MKKVIKIGFPILCIAVIGGTFVLLNKTTERINRNRLPENDEVNVVEKKENEIENAEKNIVVENVVQQTNTTVVNAEEAKALEVKNKAKAIDIVKKYAPPVSNSYYTNEGVKNNKYIVAVRDNTSKEASIYYSVDIETENFKIYVK